MFLKAIPTSVCLNKFVVFLIIGLYCVNVVHILFLFLSLIWSWFVGLCCIWRFRRCRSVCGKTFWAISCINVHSFCFLLGVSGRECILVMWCRNAATLCSTGWFERKLIVLSVVVRLRYMPLSRLDVFLIMSKSRKFIHLLFSYVGLSLCLYLLIKSACVLVVSFIISTSSM